MDAKKNSQKTGNEAEETARKLLVKKGFTILHRNWRFRKYEVDIIAENADFIVFVEVKGRTDTTMGEPEEFVTKQKQKFIISAANHYIQERDITKEARFDIISVLVINNNITVKHLEDAWYASLK
ncbi:MAG: putative endonuclease related to Holliday junction resolvase [Bacteroidetes bacterium]|jgi:putative endonuclease|nr:putative endonuclease related to Holliday junction resolvase [Bacteroidota bacterium]